MSLIVPNVARFTINGHTNLRPTAQVQDVWLDQESGSLDRAEAISDCAGDIINYWCDLILPSQMSGWTFDSVSFVDLDSENGVVGVQTVGADETLPQNGGTSGEMLPYNTALLVTKRTISQRGLRNGRMYVPGFGEQNAANGAWTSAFITAMQPQFNALYDGIDIPDERRPVVVHYTSFDEKGNPLTGTSRPMLSYALQARQATQRRRLRK